MTGHGPGRLRPRTGIATPVTVSVAAAVLATTLLGPAVGLLADDARLGLFTAALCAICATPTVALRVRQALREGAARDETNAALIATVDVAILACDAAGRPVMSTPLTREVHGVAPEEVGELAGWVARTGVLRADGTPLPVEELPVLRALAEGSVRDVEVVVHPPGLPRRTLVVQARALHSPDGRLLGAVQAAHDVTRVREQQRDLAISEERFRRVVEASPIGMALTDGRRYLQVNPAFCAFLGRNEPDVVGRSFVELTHPDDLQVSVEAEARLRAGEGIQHVEKRFIHADGTPRWALVSHTAVSGRDGHPLTLAQIEDITERKAAQDRLADLALRDGLTGLANRRLLLDRLQSGLNTLDEHSHTAVLFIDLDGFKAINDTHGHAVADQVLVAVADRLRSVTRDGDTVARMGGDEFVLVALDVSSEADAMILAGRIRTRLGAPLLVGGREVTVTASIGLAVVSGSERPAEELLRDADAAMYRAKVLGKDRAELFDDALVAKARARSDIEAAVRAALVEDGLRVHYQPVVDLGTGEIVGVEALVRMVGPDGELVPPGVFIPVAEEGPLIVAVGEWVLRESCRQVAHWRDTTGRDLHVAVNVSARQAARSDLAEVVRRALDESGLPPHALCLELTETALLEATRSTIDLLTRVRHSGVRIGVDDFGTGYASLTYLRELPVSFLKVDRSFVAGLPGYRDAAVVRAVVRLAQDLGMECVAEGIETEEQLASLRRLAGSAGGVRGQGFLLARPVPPVEMLALLARVPAQRKPLAELPILAP